MKVEAGKFYETVDNRKAGPMVGPILGVYTSPGFYQKTSTPSMPQWWNEDGSVYAPMADEYNDFLTREWGGVE